MPPLNLTARVQSWPLRKPFRISRGVKTRAETVIVEIGDGQITGRAECTPYGRYEETVASVIASLENLAREPERFSTLDAVAALAPGAARNAVDCALLDWQAKASGIPVARRFGLTPRPRDTAFTLSLDTPAGMFEAARAEQARPLLKIKLGGGDGDHERLEAVRKGAPGAALIVDANEGWRTDDIDFHLKACLAARVALIEQPLPANADDALRHIRSPIPICADESLHTRHELGEIAARGYQAINIKLDKSGGLTEAFAVAEAAEGLGLGIMIGCMVASSLAMAPALLLGEKARWIDLDGPLLLAEDHPDGLRYIGSRVYPPEPALWG